MDTTTDPLALKVDAALAELHYDATCARLLQANRVAAIARNYNYADEKVTRALIANRDAWRALDRARTAAAAA